MLCINLFIYLLVILIFSPSAVYVRLSLDEDLESVCPQAEWTKVSTCMWSLQVCCGPMKRTWSCSTPSSAKCHQHGIIIIPQEYIFTSVQTTEDPQLCCLYTWKCTWKYLLVPNVTQLNSRALLLPVLRVCSLYGDGVASNALPFAVVVLVLHDMFPALYVWSFAHTSSYICVSCIHTRMLERPDYSSNTTTGTHARFPL